MGLLSRIKSIFRPQATWDVKARDSWWNLTGSVATAGVRVSRESAQTLSAFYCGQRVIAETMASLPLMLRRQVDERSTENATEHPLWPLLHDAPNPEQDAATFMVMQVAFQVGWGNCYSEITRDSVGKITGLWPIHPSRIPTRNIFRNARRPDNLSEIEVGDPGEIVYRVKNDDGTYTPIPARDMLHVPAFISENGITGVGVIEWGANSLGICLATEQHAASFFANGAVSNVAIKSEKTVGKETADRLREQWQRVFGGVKNHYKTILLEDGMDIAPFSISPENSQLLLSRKFGVLEVCRWLRLQPHMLGELADATLNNIEEQGLEFIVYTMLPWIIRWEKALKRQLLTPAEKRNLLFKFNEKALLRGNAKDRAELYKSLFGMSAISPNEIRELEDMNPIPGGDEYFIPANNLVPLSMIKEYIEAQIEQMTAKPEPAGITQQQDGEDPPPNEDTPDLTNRNDLIRRIAARNGAS